MDNGDSEPSVISAKLKIRQFLKDCFKMILGRHYLQVLSRWHGLQWKVRQAVRRLWPSPFFLCASRAKPEPCDVVLVYQMGKVGSMSVFKSLKPYFTARHFHCKEDFLRKCKNDFDFRLWGGVYFQKKIWRVVSGVREPVDRVIAAFFQNVDNPANPWFYLGSKEYVQSLSIRELEKFFQEAMPNVLDRQETWFDINIKGCFGLDVYATPFDVEKGFTIYKNSCVEALVIRQEDLRTVAVEVIRNFLGISDKGFFLKEANVSDNKWYGSIKREFIRNFRLPPERLDRIYGLRCSRHFYSPEEIQCFKRRWSSEDPTEREGIGKKTGGTSFIGSANDKV